MKRVVAIDPGHGGSDAGAVSEEKKEKHLNLKLGAEVFNQLLNLEYRPLLLRGGDYNVTLSERINRAKMRGAECFLSIHHNGFADFGVRGCESFYNPDSQRGKRLAEALHREMLGYLPGPDRGVKRGKHLYILRRAGMPAVLVEPLFITSPRDRKFADRPDYFFELGGCLVRGLHRFLRRN